MNIFLWECKRILQPLRLAAVVMVWVLGICVYFPQKVSDVDLHIAADASAIVAEYCGTHLDANERSVIEEELFTVLLADIQQQMSECEAFCNANIKTYEEYAFLRYHKTRLAAMTEEEILAIPDEQFALEFGVSKDIDRFMSEEELALLDLTVTDAEKVEEILHQCLVFQRIEDSISFWYDSRERLSEYVSETAFSIQNAYFTQFCMSDEYTGVMAYEVSENVGECFRFIGILVLFSVFILGVTEPAIDRITQMSILQTVTCNGKKVLPSQCKAAVLQALLISVIGITAAGVYLCLTTPDVLWASPLNSFQSFFTIYYFKGTLHSYFLLLSLLLVLTAVGCSLLGFAASVFAKSYTALFGFLLPMLVIAQLFSNLIFRIPFSYRQSLIGPLYLSQLLPVPMAEIPICTLLCTIGIVCGLAAVKKRKKELMHQ